MAERNPPLIELNLLHEGCGGSFRSWAEQGYAQLFRCEKCRAEAIAPVNDEELQRIKETKAKRDAEWAEQIKNLPPPLQPTGRMMTAEEASLCDAYSAWSEENYAAGFMHPFEDIVARFLNGAVSALPRQAWEYEEEFLAVVEKLKKENV